MNIADWPMRKPLVLYASILVGLCVIVPLWRNCDLPTNVTNLLIFFSGGTVIAYFASSTTEAVKGMGVANYENEIDLVNARKGLAITNANINANADVCMDTNMEMEMDTVGRSIYSNCGNSCNLPDNSTNTDLAACTDSNRTSSFKRKRSSGYCNKSIA